MCQHFRLIKEVLLSKQKILDPPPHCLNGKCVTKPRTLLLPCNVIFKDGPWWNTIKLVSSDNTFSNISKFCGDFKRQGENSKKIILKFLQKNLRVQLRQFQLQLQVNSINQEIKTFKNLHKTTTFLFLSHKKIQERESRYSKTFSFYPVLGYVEMYESCTKLLFREHQKVHNDPSNLTENHLNFNLSIQFPYNFIFSNYCFW